MKRRFLIFSAIFFAAFCLPVVSANAQSGRVKPTPTPDPDEKPVRIITEEVKVNIIAFDANGKFVEDVVPTDLVITENDILHQANSLRRLPANVLIIMDTGGALRSVKTLDQTRSVAAGLVNALRPEDPVAVIQYADDVTVAAEWTTDRKQILSAIKKTDFGRGSAFAHALRLGTKLLQNTPNDNRHMVLITDGTDDKAGSSAVDEAMRDILSTDINVHVLSYTRLETRDIDPRTKAVSNSPPPKAMPDEIAATLPNGVRETATAPKIGPTINLDRKLLKVVRARKADLEQSERRLDQLTRDTNGVFILPDSTDEMTAKTLNVARIIDAGYVLTYTPKIPFAENSEDRNISVTSKRPGLVVEAKRKLIVNTADTSANRQ